MSQPELSRTVRVDTLGAAPRRIRIEANDAERAALRRRFALTALDRLEADVDIRQAEHDIVAAGSLSAQVTQACVATHEPVPARVEEKFEIRFRPEGAAALADEEEVELGEDELDVMFYDGAMIDVGEAVAQTLALNLDPYPRAPEAGDALREAGVVDEEAAGPFNALAAALKEKLGK
jgi:uncharacterized metal-binding protein YceD (DUF177 family)